MIFVPLTDSLPNHTNALHSKHLQSLPYCNKRGFQLFFNCRKAK